MTYQGKEMLPQTYRNLELEQEQMRIQRNRRLAKQFLWFFIIMLVLTFVSRMIYVSHMPRISTNRMASGSLDYMLQAEGVVEAASPQMIYGLDGLRVSQIFVSHGMRVEAGTVLYQVDTEDLEMKLAELIAEHHTLQAQAGGRPTELERFQASERERKIAQWQELLGHNGEVVMEKSGMILDMALQTGVRMTDEPVLYYSDADSALIFRAIIQPEQKSMIHTGDTVTIRFMGNGEEIRTEVDSLMQIQTGYEASIRLEAGIGVGETEGVMEFQHTSQVYEYVVPLNAVHVDAAGAYIYVLKEQDGILGTELTAGRVNVRILEQSAEKAAIYDALLEADMRVITVSDMELSDGAAVREDE